MVESAYLRKGNNVSELLPVREPRLGRILLAAAVDALATDLGRQHEQWVAKGHDFDSECRGTPK